MSSLFLSDTTVFSQGDLFQQVSVGGHFQRGALLCDNAFFSTTYNAVMKNMGCSSIHGIGSKIVSWLQVLRLSLRLAVTLCNHQFAVLHSGAFVWATSQHQKDCATLGFPWLVFRVCV